MSNWSSFKAGVKRFGRRTLPQRLTFRIDLARTVRASRRLAAKSGNAAARHHSLPKPLIVSLTSFEPRFVTLHLTLKSLLSQSVAPDLIVLWIAHEELRMLPARVRRLGKKGISIRGCEDIGSYKKLIHALEEFPDAFIATADDDMYYEPRWLETLVSRAQASKPAIACHRAHRIALDESGNMAPYENWEVNVQDEAARISSKDLVPTGCGGVLYPPNCFSSEVSDRSLFQRLAPTADDLWFYWMARRAGTEVMKVGGRFAMMEWPNPQTSRLWEVNRAGANDRQVSNLQAQFGNPITGADHPSGASE